MQFGSSQSSDISASLNSAEDSGEVIAKVLTLLLSLCFIQSYLSSIHVPYHFLLFVWPLVSLCISTCPLLHPSPLSHITQSTQGAYIPLALLRSTPIVDSPNEHSFQSFGYQSFGSTDRMGRKSSSSSPTNGHQLSATVAVQQSSSTLERCAQMSKGSNGGAGSARQVSSLGDMSGLKELDSPKAFV